jgi:hypothetical protein
MERPDFWLLPFGCSPHIVIGLQLIRDFHFACPATKEYNPECPARHLFRIRSNGKAPFLPRGSSAQAKKP